jgi:hypothetical protein
MIIRTGSRQFNFVRTGNVAATLVGGDVGAGVGGAAGEAVGAGVGAAEAEAVGAVLGDDDVTAPVGVVDGPHAASTAMTRTSNRIAEPFITSFCQR